MPAIRRSAGTTESEEHLSRLADKTFLDLWSYPNLYIDKRTAPEGEGKELCDLLVVCGDHVLIFSVKSIEWPSGGTELAWKRWYKRAIKKSAAQLRGAERWLESHPERIFLDRACKEPFPLKLPPPPQRKTHRILVALGAGMACSNHFGGDLGSLLIVPSLRGDDHLEDEAPLFGVGDVDPAGSFVHVLDDVTLDIVMTELDTVSDLTSYLSKKEAFIRSGRLQSANGEEELLAYYLMHMNESGEHDFTRPDGSLWDNVNATIGTGFYENLKNHPQYIAKKQADEISYLCDTLISAFTENLRAGTSITIEGASPELRELEQGVRELALLPRVLRRVYGQRIATALDQGQRIDRSMSAFLPGPDETDRRVGFFFLTVTLPEPELGVSYDRYRLVRREYLKGCALALLNRNRHLNRVVGVACEPPNAGSSSEDLILMDMPDWTDEVLATLESYRERLDIDRDDRVQERRTQILEYPERAIVPPVDSPSQSSSQKGNRRERRAAAARQRRRKRRGPPDRDS